MNKQNEQLKILIADDEPDILEFVCYNLIKEGYHVFAARNGEEALSQARLHRPHLILLDVMMPILDGVETCRALREIPELKTTVIAFLTARAEEFAQLAGFDAGADDYLTKPIKPKLFVSRVAALLRRFHNYAAMEATTTIPLSDWIIHINEYKIIHKITNDTQVIPKKEFELLRLLAQNIGKVVLREEIFSKIWGEEVQVGTRTIDVHIKKIRNYVGDDKIVTVKGVGYRLNY
jgi:two-component system, OmpR family, alkaline phosphatase synthesis response regulator PhoP